MEENLSQLSIQALTFLSQADLRFVCCCFFFDKEILTDLLKRVLNKGERPQESCNFTQAWVLGSTF